LRQTGYISTEKLNDRCLKRTRKTSFVNFVGITTIEQPDCQPIKYLANNNFKGANNQERLLIIANTLKSAALRKLKSHAVIFLNAYLLTIVSVILGNLFTTSALQRLS